MLTRDFVREQISKAGITCDNVTDAQIMDLMNRIRSQFKAARKDRAIHGCYTKSMYLNNLKPSKYLTVRSDNFKDRECISFNRDGFIGFAGWADDKNVQQILIATLVWINEIRKES